jgi:hypothetical protein
MIENSEPHGDSEETSALLLLARNQETRLAKLEETQKKTLFARLTEDAGAIALLLGLLLTVTSLYNILVTQPAADRIADISAFNKAVIAATERQQQVLKFRLLSKICGRSRARVERQVYDRA